MEIRKEFFSHEVQSFPPARSDFGNRRLPSAKSDPLKCLLPTGHDHIDPPAQFDCKVLDGAVIVHCLSKAEAEKVFIPLLLQQLNQSKRVDVVWDTYILDSLKEPTTEKRGQGVRRKVAGQTKLPKNWMMFLQDPNNKSELFSFLKSKVARSQCPLTEHCTLHPVSNSSLSY